MTAHDVEFLGLTFVFAAVLLCSSKTPSEGVVSPAPTQCSQRVSAQLGFPYIPWHCRGTDAPVESDSSQRCTTTGWERSQAAAGKSQQFIRKKLFTGSLEQVAQRGFEIPVPNLDATLGPDNLWRSLATELCCESPLCSPLCPHHVELVLGGTGQCMARPGTKWPLIQLVIF